MSNTNSNADVVPNMVGNSPLPTIDSFNFGDDIPVEVQSQIQTFVKENVLNGMDLQRMKTQLEMNAYKKWILDILVSLGMTSKDAKLYLSKITDSANSASKLLEGSIEI